MGGCVSVRGPRAGRGRRTGSRPNRSRCGCRLGGGCRGGERRRVGAWAGLACRLVTVGRPPRASRTARTATRLSIKADRAGCRPTDLPAEARRAGTDAHHSDGWKDPVRLAPSPTGPVRRGRGDAMKALPDGQWATADAHPSTGGAASVGDRQPWSGAWEPRTSSG